LRKKRYTPVTLNSSWGSGWAFDFARGFVQEIQRHGPEEGEDKTAGAGGFSRGGIPIPDKRMEMQT